MPSGAVKWTISEPTSEYRTIFFNRPVAGQERRMWTKEQMHFNPLFAEDTKLRSPEDMIYSPQSFFMTKPKTRTPVPVPKIKPSG